LYRELKEILNKMNYQINTKENLIQYKKEVLNVSEKGINGNDGPKRRYGHILPARLEKLNIIEHYRDDFFNSGYAAIKNHECFHHLNSSQALCINLFFPLIAEGRMDLYLELLNLPMVEIVNPAFEFESDIEQGGRRKTNFDLYFEILRQLRIYFEIKYTEQVFGSAKNDQSHRDKFEKTYLPLLIDNPFIREEYKELAPFLENYQILRNLVHIRDDSMVVFLYPRANKEIHKQALLAADEMVTDRGKKRLKLLALEETVQHIKSSLESGRLKRHFDEFEEKYLQYK